MMIISNNDNNLGVELLQQLVLMDAASNSSLLGNCVGPPGLHCFVFFLNLRENSEAWKPQVSDECASHLLVKMATC